MSATDRGIDRRLQRFCRDEGLRTRVYPDALFLTPAREVDEWFAAHATARMEDFYRWQRRRTGILMDGSAPPASDGTSTQTTANRFPAAASMFRRSPRPSTTTSPEPTIAEVAARFADSPGDPSEFWLPVTPDAAREWLEDFTAHRLPLFGRYEDAMAADEPFLFHSVLSPLLNIGLLEVDEVVQSALASDAHVPLASLEGFVRQVIGWREYMRGAYRAMPALDRREPLRPRRGGSSRGGTPAAASRTNCPYRCAPCSSGCTGGGMRITSSGSWSSATGSSCRATTRVRCTTGSRPSSSTRTSG